RAGEFFGKEDAAGGGVVELEAFLLPLPVKGGVRGGRRSIGLDARASLFQARTHPRPLPSREGSGIRRVEVRQAFGQLQRLLEAVGEAWLDPFADDDAVDHDL